MTAKEDLNMDYSKYDFKDSTELYVYLSKKGLSRGTVEEISRKCGAGTGCGACVEELRERLLAKGAGGCSRDCASEHRDLANDLVPVRLAR